jgi:hypothetical protein
VKHPNQQTNYRVPTRSPFERQANGKYLVEKLIDDGHGDARWVVMSFGDQDRDARPGQELDQLIRRAHALEGRVRIVRQNGRVLVWDSEDRS